MQENMKKKQIAEHTMGDETDCQNKTGNANTMGK